MKNTIAPTTLRSCRDYIKGRYSASTSGNELNAGRYASIRCYLRSQYPPLRGERLRKTVLGIIGTLTAISALFVLLAA
ncbi:hypothetical protein CEQ90_06345 [Lewinellaceae bacterium SD302]|nr:hypothetical protein CEQ90_06345 [Lewinellaceae bacterium SD302]